MLDSIWATLPMIIVYSLIFLILTGLIVRKRQFALKKIKVMVILAIVSSVVITAVSVIYREKTIGGTYVWHNHGLPHYYLIEGRLFENEAARLQIWESNDIFMQKDIDNVVNGIRVLYLSVDLLFWFTLSLFFMVAFKMLTSRKTSPDSTGKQQREELYL